MEVCAKYLIGVPIVLVVLAAACAAPTVQEVESPPLVPGDGDLTGWVRTAEPETYVGEDLFQLINGGAEMYHEFGFVEVVAAEYEDQERRAITFELFEMKDDAAAYGVYTFKKGEGGRALEIADGCVVQDYYLNCWAGRYVLTLTGMEADPKTVEGLEMIADATSNLIGETATELPALVVALSSVAGRSFAVHYLRGDLALSNLLAFGGGVRFFFEDGAETTVGDFQVLALSYESSEAAGHHLEKTVDELIGGDRFVLDTDEPDREGALLTDEDGVALWLVSIGPRIVCVFGSTAGEARAVLDDVMMVLAGEDLAVGNFLE